MTYEDVPLTSSDLRDIAKTLDGVIKRFGEEDNDYTAFGRQFYNIKLDVMRLGGDEVVGTIGYYDGWLGFWPKGEEK